MRKHATGPALRAGPACVALTWLPMLAALGGVWLDERLHLGYSTWLSACRAGGVSAASVFAFTLELLPLGVIGLLAGGLAVLVIGTLWRDARAARLGLAAHAGCAVGMAAGLLLCTLAAPMPLLLLAEALFAALIALALLRRTRHVPRAASVKPRTRAPASA